jgi:hypothetical protein
MRCLVRGPWEIVEWINKNDVQNFKYFSKYRGNFCSVIGSTGITSVHYQLRLGFASVTSSLRLDASVVSYSLCWLYTFRKGKAIPVQTLRVPGGWLQISRQPYWSAAFSPRNYSWGLFVLEAESSPVATGRLKSMKTSSDTWNRTGDLPNFSAVPQPNGPPPCTQKYSLQ